MALTGLQIFKLLPGTNCRDCGHPTCLAFAMKLAAGKESLDKCPDASDEVKAALGAASAPPIRGVTVGAGERAVTVGEETVFFRHEKTFVHHPAFFRLLDPAGKTAEETEAMLKEWAAVRIDRAGEVFRIDGVAIAETPGALDESAAAAAAAAKQGLPAAVMAATPEGARAILEELKGQKPLLVPPVDADRAPYIALAKELETALVVAASDLDELAAAAAEAASGGLEEILLDVPGGNARELHHNLTLIRRGALDRAHPGLAYPVFLHVGCRDLEKGVLGISKFASFLVIDDQEGEAWLPLWTLRQNIYTDPQKPLRMDAGIYTIGEPDEKSPLLVTTNFSLTYFIVSTELDGTGQACHLAVVESEGMSVLTAWSAGKFSGDLVGKALLEMGAADLVGHRKVIIPGYVAVISGELEDSMGSGWKVLTGPQEASDIGPFLRDVWEAAGTG